MITVPSPLRKNSNGSLSVGVPNSAISGGNARGANAVDLQQSRTAASQVASAANSTLVGGTGSTASAGNSVAGGESNSATATSAIAIGGGGNSANGAYSTIVGGRQASTRGTYGRIAYGSGSIATGGDAQLGEFVLRAATTDATVTRLTADATAVSTINTANLPNSGTYLCRVMIAARQTGGVAGTAGDSSGWTAELLIKRGAAAVNTALVGTPSITRVANDAATAAWTVTLAADTTNGGLAVSGTGEVSKNINWVARVLSVEVVG